MNIFKSVKRFQNAKNPQPGKVSKKTPYGRIIEKEIIAGFEFSFHATKGWRQRSPLHHLN